MIYASGGGEAVDIAIKTARHATGKRKIVSIVKAYHGHTGLAVTAGDDRFAKLFLADRPDEVAQVPVQRPRRDGAGPARARRRRRAHGVDPRDVRIPAARTRATSSAVKQLCEQYDALYVADEVQTGLMRTGELWCITKHGIAPDILVTGKGLSGGMYPIAAVLVSERCAGWLTEDGFAHMSTFGGAEVGCIAAHEDPGDLQPPGDPLDGALPRRPVCARACGRSAATTRTGSSASGRTAW